MIETIGNIAGSVAVAALIVLVAFGTGMLWLLAVALVVLTIGAYAALVPGARWTRERLTDDGRVERW